jgi:hypothetical protein
MFSLGRALNQEPASPLSDATADAEYSFVEASTEAAPCGTALAAGKLVTSSGLAMRVERQKTPEEQARLYQEKVDKSAQEAFKLAHRGHSENRSLKPYSGRPLQVHLVPYSRTDVGFKKTVDEYYSGANQNAHHAFVESILDSVVEELKAHPDRRFTFSEVKYLQMWYTRQDKTTQELLKRLIKSG